MERETSVNNKIAIIGAGHIGMALAEGLLRSRGVHASRLFVASRSVARKQELKRLGLILMKDNTEVARKADMIFLAVKPSVVEEVVKEIKDSAKGKIIVSLATGVSVGRLQKAAGASVKIARAMPNMPIAFNQGIIGLFGKSLSFADRARVKKILSSLGMLIEVRDENELDVLTLVSGCGPGIVAYFVNTFARSAKALGVSDEKAEMLALHTFKGTLAYMEKSKLSPIELIQSVATKGGVTETILHAFSASGVEKKILGALRKGHERISLLKKR